VNYYATTATCACPKCGVEWEVPAFFEYGATFVRDEEHADICPLCMTITDDTGASELVAPDVQATVRGMYVSYDGRLMELGVAAELEWADAHPDE
jgi:hypothetical protein